MTIVNVDSAWLAGKTPPYHLATAGAMYQLMVDVTTPGLAFILDGNNITFDLGGHAITYDDAPPMVVANGGFEAGDLSGWDVSRAPDARVIPAVLGMYGSWMLGFVGIRAPQTIVSAPIAILQAGIAYLAGIQAKSYAFGQCQAALSVIDSVTGAVLGPAGTPGPPSKLDPGGGPILKVNFTPATTNPVLLKIDVTMLGTAPATLWLDSAFCDRQGMNGVGIAYKTATVRNGTIRQGRARSAISPAIFGYASKMTLDGLRLESSGCDTNIVYGNWAKGATITNCDIVGGVDRISNRQAANAAIYLMASIGSIDIRDNWISGKHQNGIVFGGGNGMDSFSSITIKGNDIRLDSSWSDSYGIGLAPWARNFDVSENTIVPVSGRGILVDTGNAIIDGGSIRNNHLEARERGNLEYGKNLNVVAFRVRNWVGTIRNLVVDGNTCVAETGIGPGIPDHAVQYCSGGRISLYNDAGQQANCNITFSNNLFRAIVASPDPAVPSNAAFGLTFKRYDAGMGVKWLDNTCESNNIALNFGDADGSNTQDLEMTGTTLVKSTEGSTETRGLTPGFLSMVVGNWGGPTHGVRLFDTTFEGGALPTPTFTSVAAKDMATGYTLAVEAESGVNVTISDASGAVVATGTTAAAGLLVVPIVLAKYAVAANSANHPVVTTTPQPLKVTAGGKSVDVTLTGPATVTISDEPTPAEGACVLDGSGDLTAEGAASWDSAEGACVLDGSGDLAGEGAARWRFIVYDPVPY